MNYNPKVMRLESVETIAVRADALESAFVKIDTDTGLTGWGEVQAPRVPAAACEIVHALLRPVLEGVEFHGKLQEIAQLREKMRAMETEAASGVELALWDLAGKLNDRPVCRLISAMPCRNQVPAFDRSRSPGKTVDARRLTDIIGTLKAPVAIRVGVSLGPLLAAAIQFAATLPEGSAVEYDPAVVEAAGRLTGFSPPREGKYAVSRLPGLGIEVDEPELRLMEQRSR